MEAEAEPSASALMAPGPLLAGNQLLETVKALRPAPFVKRTPRLGGEDALINNQPSPLAQFPKRERDDRLAIIRVRWVPSKRVGQASQRLDLAELSLKIEQIAVGWLHRDPVAASDTRVELDAGSSKPSGAPPFRKLVRVCMRSENERPRRGRTRSRCSVSSSECAVTPHLQSTAQSRS